MRIYFFLFFFLGNWQIAFCQEKTLPIGRSLHAIAFNQSTGEMFIFGGKAHYKSENANVSDNQLWLWKDGIWQVAQSSNLPWREDAKMVYHEKNQKNYLLGGRVYDTEGKVMVLDEFWEWNGKVWQLINSSNSPNKRLHFNMVYDSHRQKIVLFGGAKIDSLSKSTFSNEVWEWDGEKWENLMISEAPSPRLAHSMTYSKALKKTLVIGGVNDKGEYLRDMWAWDGKKFELLSSQVPDIEFGMGNAVSIDEGNKIKILLFGRSKPTKDEPSKSKTFLWNGKTWEELGLSTQPSLRENHTLVFDSRNKQVLLFGGSGREESQFQSPNDVWIFRNNHWILIPN
jgi:hypothetical protein